jgi:hypothetical protein
VANNAFVRFADNAKDTNGNPAPLSPNLHWVSNDVGKTGFYGLTLASIDNFLLFHSVVTLVYSFTTPISFAHPEADIYIAEYFVNDRAGPTSYLRDGAGKDTKEAAPRGENQAISITLQPLAPQFGFVITHLLGTNFTVKEVRVTTVCNFPSRCPNPTTCIGI